jgi:hypothetical protein
MSHKVIRRGIKKAGAIRFKVVPLRSFCLRGKGYEGFACWHG